MSRKRHDSSVEKRERWIAVNQDYPLVAQYRDPVVSQSGLNVLQNGYFRIADPWVTASCLSHVLSITLYNTLLVHLVTLYNSLSLNENLKQQGLDY